MPEKLKPNRSIEACLGTLANNIGESFLSDARTEYAELQKDARRWQTINKLILGAGWDDWVDKLEADRADAERWREWKQTKVEQMDPIAFKREWLSQWAPTSEPMAYAVFCNAGEEFEYRVFANRLQAEMSLAPVEGDPEQVLIPLYRKDDDNGN